MQKQLKYANSKKIPFAIICGDEELEKGIVQVKNLDNGEQEEIKESELVRKVKDPTLTLPL
jgi:histidyl-tRNA synthetase